MIQVARILVPVKGAPPDDDALALACQIAKKYKARLYALHVIEVKRQLPLDAAMPTEISRGEDILDRADALARRYDVEIESELLQARDVGAAIVDYALERSADLIVLGLSYKQRYGEFDLGKTVPYVLKHAPCRVWVCRQETTFTGREGG